MPPHACACVCYYRRWWSSVTLMVVLLPWCCLDGASWWWRERADTSGHMGELHCGSASPTRSQFILTWALGWLTEEWQVFLLPLFLCDSAYSYFMYCIFLYNRVCLWISFHVLIPSHMKKKKQWKVQGLCESTTTTITISYFSSQDYTSEIWHGTSLRPTIPCP